MPDISTLIKKSDYDRKIAELESKYVSNTGFDSKLARANVITKRNFDEESIEIETNIKKLQTFDSSYFRGKNYFNEDGTQNYLVFQPIHKYCKLNANTWYILSWKSKGLSTENISPPNTNFSPSINYVGHKIRVKFTRSCLKQSNKLTYTYGKIINI